MKQLNTLVAAIAMFCCSTFLQAQTLEDLVNLDALLACECELVLEPVCVDLGVGVTFPAPNACVAECLALPVVEGGEPVTTFTRGGPGSQNGHFHLPDGWHEGSIELTPLDPEGVYGGFWMERVVDLGGGGPGWGCDALMFELERDEVTGVWVEVRHRDKDGAWWSSARACDDVPEGPWLFDVTDVQDLGTVQGWDAVEMSCDLALPMARSDEGQDWVSLEVTGLTVAVPR